MFYELLSYVIGIETPICRYSLCIVSDKLYLSEIEIYNETLIKFAFSLVVLIVHCLVLGVGKRMQETILKSLYNLLLNGALLQFCFEWSAPIRNLLSILDVQ